MSIFDTMLSDPTAMNNAGTSVTAVGDIIGGISHFQFGQQAQAAEDFQAAQLRQNAGQVEASAQRQAYDVNLQTKMVMSRALAVAAGSGGGASDPTVVSLIARDAARGAYLQSSALYGGESKARQMDLEADAKEFKGKNTAMNSDLVAGSQFFKAGTNIMQGAARDASLFQRFGAGGPKTYSDPTG